MGRVCADRSSQVPHPSIEVPLRCFGPIIQSETTTPFNPLDSTYYLKNFKDLARFEVGCNHSIGVFP